jgi:hypothetical protein
MASRTTTWFNSLARVFPPDRLHIRVARLIVLYEDLRIEESGILARTIPPLEMVNNGDYRIRYFLRRTVCTLLEFAEAFRLVDSLDQFNDLRVRFDGTRLKQWNEAVDFFKQEEPLIRRIRNDLGGHFGEEATEYAVKGFLPGTKGRIEYYRDVGSRKATILNHYVGEITARAFLRHVPGGSVEDKSRYLLELLRKGYRLAARAVTALIAVEVLSSRSSWYCSRKLPTSACTASARCFCAPSRKTSVKASLVVAGCWIETTVSFFTAYPPPSVDDGFRVRQLSDAPHTQVSIIARSSFPLSTNQTSLLTQKVGRLAAPESSTDCSQSSFNGLCHRDRVKLDSSPNA